MAMEHTPEQIRARALEEAEEAVWAYHIFHQPGTWTAQERETYNRGLQTAIDAIRRIPKHLGDCNDG